MKATDFRWFVIGYLVLWIAALEFHSDETIGLNAYSFNGQYSYRAGSAPWAIAIAFVGLVLYFLLISSKVVSDQQRVPYLFRRWVAGLVDLVPAMLIPTAFMGLAAILLEYRRTGVFEWLVDRQEYQSSDWLYVIGSILLLMFVLAPSYFALSWWRGKPTLGSWQTKEHDFIFGRLDFVYCLVHWRCSLGHVGFWRIG